MNAGDSMELQCLLEKIYHDRGFDFREYKETTLRRRLGQRLHACGVETFADYALILDQNPAEYDRLFNCLTIKVTNFFRDDVAFRAVEEVVLPTLIGKGPKDVRVWSAGCATGQEPYSVALLLLEKLGQEISQWNITILGTDIDAKALACAHNGRFTKRDVEGIRPAWLERYFVPEGKGFRIQPALSRLVTFEVHNLVRDPPYHDLDLVVCRNVLIYFKPVLQMRVLGGFYEGLKQGGFLLLGKAELPMGETRALFNCLDGKAKLFRKVVTWKGTEKRLKEWSS